MPSPYSFFAHKLSPLVLGTILTCPLFGITTAQTIWYFRQYPQDSTFLKFWIAALFVIDLTQTISVASATISVFIRAEVSLAIPIESLVDLYVTSLTITMVQCAYTYRVWIMSDRSRGVTVFLMFLTLCQTVSGVGMAMVQQVNGNAIHIHNTLTNAFAIFELISKLACDLLISTSLVYWLNKKRSGLRRTENLVDKLILYVVGVGLLTSVTTLIVFIVWLAMPKSLTFMIFHSILSKLYVNSLLVTLNSRAGLTKADRKSLTSVPLATMP